jgi:hypothetical protein
VTDAVVQRNYIAGVEAGHSEIGYGVQVKLGSTAAIRDNVIVRTKGPGIMVYGSRDRARASVIEGNFVADSRTSSGLVLGGGPVVVRNNISVGAAEAGIAIEDYGGRGLLHGVVIAYNSVYGGRRAGIRAPGGGPIDAQVVFNAVHALAGPLLPMIRPGLLVRGNVDCRLPPCFMDPLGLNFRPVDGSLLVGRPDATVHAPSQDFFGIQRPAESPTIGAVEERADGTVRLGRKPKR